ATTPVVTFTGTSENGSTVTVSVDDSDPATPAVVGAAPAGPTGSWSTQLGLSSLRDGALTATAWATDAHGNVGSPTEAAGAKDATAPTARMTAPRRTFTLGAVRASWTGLDAGSGLASAPYDVRWSRAAHGTALGGYHRLASGVATRSLTRTLSPGTTACFQVRSHDAVGNVSHWSAARCTTAVLDDRAMSATPAWSRVSD